MAMEACAALIIWRRMREQGHEVGCCRGIRPPYVKAQKNTSGMPRRREAATGRQRFVELKSEAHSTQILTVPGPGSSASAALINSSAPCFWERGLLWRRDVVV